MSRIFAVIVMVIAISSAGVQAQQVGITPDQSEARLTLSGGDVTIRRIQDIENELTGVYARTSRPCPAECIVPMRAAPGIETVAELEVIAFLELAVSEDKGFLVDTRSPQAYAAGHIPGAVNVPHTILTSTNPFRSQILIALGARETSNGALDFQDAKALTLYCDGPWCASAGDSLRTLAEAGYPINKLLFYRGGMQSWQLMGFNVQR